MTKSIKKDLNKVNKILHPRSRKAQKLHQKASRLITRDKSKKFHKMKENLIGEKLLWFKERLIPDVRVYTNKMCLDIIEIYFSRFDEELDQISIVHSMKGRKNRRFANREDIINMTILHEKEEFETCGFEIPDLLNEQQLNMLRNWNGELRYLQNFHLKRFHRKGLEENKYPVKLDTTSITVRQNQIKVDHIEGSSMQDDNAAADDDDDSDDDDGDGDDDDDNVDDNDTGGDKDSEWSDISEVDEENEKNSKLLQSNSKLKKVRFNVNKNKKRKSSEETMDVE